ncbi:MAG: HD domain-containing protein [Planctomycetota bacterium]|nr:HD domain-containing protein [Planctomycetota bacterium]
MFRNRLDAWLSGRLKRWLRSRSPRIESLKGRLTLGTSLLMVAILYIIYSALSHTARDTASREALMYAEDLASYFAATIAESAAAKDTLQVHVQSRAILDNGVDALVVRSGDGSFLYASHGGLQDKSLYRSAGSPPDVAEVLSSGEPSAEQFIYQAKSIEFGDKIVGIIHLWFSRSDFEKRVEEANAFIYPIFALGFLLMLFLGITVLFTPFRALRRLTDVARQIGAGDLSARVPVRGHDEIAGFCRAFNSMVDGLSQARKEIQRKHLQIIQAMISTVEAKDSYTQGHCVRVQAYARKILRNFPDLPKDQKARIETAALLHDIGKIGIPDEVLFKAHGLNEKEVEIARSHVTTGETILLHLDSMKDVARWVRHHHERWDGLGYPDGLRGEATPFASRVICVSDSIDAMLTDRPYRKALCTEETIEALLAGKAKQFDPVIADHAIACLRSRSAVETEALQSVEG